MQQNGSITTAELRVNMTSSMSPFGVQSEFDRKVQDGHMNNRSSSHMRYYKLVLKWNKESKHLKKRVL